MSLLATAPKVTKSAAAADKRLKINEHLPKRKELASQPACILRQNQIFMQQIYVNLHMVFLFEQ
ncbi:MAG: hypothetical protein JXA77_13295, partial [Bacteroidales bacterium]|nr:hypothetical protein [Bacteroidales bacterium]